VKPFHTFYMMGVPLINAHAKGVRKVKMNRRIFCATY